MGNANVVNSYDTLLFLKFDCGPIVLNKNSLSGVCSTYALMSIIKPG